MVKTSKARTKLGSFGRIRMRIPGGARITQYFKRKSRQPANSSRKKK